MAAHSVALTVPALPASLDAVQDLVADLWSGLGPVGAADRSRFETAVAEIAGNVIEHAVPGAGAAAVTLTVTASADPWLLTAVLEDDGEEIWVDVAGASMPGAGAENGRGLALARSLTDSIRYERDGTANRWTIVCRRHPAV